MIITRRRAADRSGAASPGWWVGLRPAPLRWLLLACVVLLLYGVWTADRAQRSSFAQARAALAAGNLVDLRVVAEPEALEPLLRYPTASERRFVAQRLVAALVNEQVANVGALAALAVPRAEIDAGKAPELAKRASSSRDSEHGSGALEGSVALLSAAELAALKPFLIVRPPEAWRQRLYLAALVLVLAFAMVWALWRWRGFAGDRLFLVAALGLSSIGFLIMVTVRDPLRDLLLFVPFTQGVAGGCVLLAAATLVPLPRGWIRLGMFGSLATAVALSFLLAVLGSGPGSSDAKVNLFGAQPVPWVLLAVVIFLAGYLGDRWEMLREVEERRSRLVAKQSWLRLPRLEYLLPPCIGVLLVLLFFAVQRDLGPALVLALLFLGLYAVARGRWLGSLGGLAAVVAAFGFAYWLGTPRTVGARVAMWLEPWSNVVPGGDHVAQSLWAFASGGLWGTGLGRGEPGQVAEVHTDLVLSAVGEQLGFAGVAIVLLLQGLLLQRAYVTVRATSRPHERFLALGAALLLFLQLFLIVGGVLGLLPLSGLVTPFLSYGRSAMLANFLCLGILVRLSSEAALGTRSGRSPVAPLEKAERQLARLVAVALLALFAVAAWVQVVRDERLLARPVYALHGDGVVRPRYNPRLISLAVSIPRGAVVDRTLLPIATSEPPDLEQFADRYAQLDVLARPQTLSSPRAYPLGGVFYHLIGEEHEQLQWAASNTSFVERDERSVLQGFEDHTRMVPVRQPGGGVVLVPSRDLTALVPLWRRHRQGRSLAPLIAPDRSVVTTIDAGLQLRLGEILARRTAAVQSEHAAAVVIDASTGALLAAVSVPWPERIDAQELAVAPERYLDRARYGLYPPGSTFKLVTAIAALRAPGSSAERTYRCESLGEGRSGAYVRGWGRPVRDDRSVARPHGLVSLEDGLVRSCNAYFAQLATYAVGASDLLETADLFGIRVAAPNTAEALADALAQAGYGQGQVLATPLQMARVVAAIANDGVLREVHWLAAKTADAGAVRVLAVGPARFLASALRRTAREGAAATVLASVAPALAGKTGTAEVASARSHSWFVGFLPAAEGPRIAFAVVIENGGYGSAGAAAVARDLAAEIAAMGLIGPRDS